MSPQGVVDTLGRLVDFNSHLADHEALDVSIGFLREVREGLESLRYLLGVARAEADSYHEQLHGLESLIELQHKLSLH